MAISITFYKEFDKSGSAIAQFGFKIEQWDMYFSKCRLIHGKDGQRFISFPSEKYKDENGQDKWAPYYWWGKETKTKLQAAVLEAIDAYCQEKRSQVKEAVDKYNEDNLPF